MKLIYQRHVTATRAVGACRGTRGRGESESGRQKAGGREGERGSEPGASPRKAVCHVGWRLSMLGEKSPVWEESFYLC